MTLKVTGAVLVRTGTLSMIITFEWFLGCTPTAYVVAFVHPEHMSTWHATAKGVLAYS